MDNNTALTTPSKLDGLEDSSKTPPTLTNHNIDSLKNHTKTKNPPIVKAVTTAGDDTWSTRSIGRRSFMKQRSRTRSFKAPVPETLDLDLIKSYVRSESLKGVDRESKPALDKRLKRLKTAEVILEKSMSAEEEKFVEQVSRRKESKDTNRRLSIFQAKQFVPPPAELPSPAIDFQFAALDPDQTVGKFEKLFKLDEDSEDEDTSTLNNNPINNTNQTNTNNEHNDTTIRTQNPENTQNTPNPPPHNNHYQSQQIHQNHQNRDFNDILRHLNVIQEQEIHNSSKGISKPSHNPQMRKFSLGLSKHVSMEEPRTSNAHNHSAKKQQMRLLSDNALVSSKPKKASNFRRMTDRVDQMLFSPIADRHVDGEGQEEEFSDLQTGSHFDRVSAGQMERVDTNTLSSKKRPKTAYNPSPGGAAEMFGGSRKRIRPFEFDSSRKNSKNSKNSKSSKNGKNVKLGKFEDSFPPPLMLKRIENQNLDEPTFGGFLGLRNPNQVGFDSSNSSSFEPLLEAPLQQEVTNDDSSDSGILHINPKKPKNKEKEGCPDMNSLKWLGLGTFANLIINVREKEKKKKKAEEKAKNRLNPENREYGLRTSLGTLEKRKRLSMVSKATQVSLCNCVNVVEGREGPRSGGKGAMAGVGVGSFEGDAAASPPPKSGSPVTARESAVTKKRPSAQLTFYRANTNKTNTGSEDLESAIKRIELNQLHSDELSFRNKSSVNRSCTGLSGFASFNQRNPATATTYTKHQEIDFSALNEKTILSMLKEIEDEKSTLLKRLSFLNHRLRALRQCLTSNNSKQSKQPYKADKKDSVDQRIMEFQKTLKKSQSLQEFDKPLIPSSHKPKCSEQLETSSLKDSGKEKSLLNSQAISKEGKGLERGGEERMGEERMGEESLNLRPILLEGSEIDYLRVNQITVEEVVEEEFGMEIKNSFKIPSSPSVKSGLMGAENGPKMENFGNQKMGVLGQKTEDYKDIGVVEGGKEVLESPVKRRVSGKEIFSGEKLKKLLEKNEQKSGNEAINEADLDTGRRRRKDISFSGYFGDDEKRLMASPPKKENGLSRPIQDNVEPEMGVDRALMRDASTSTHQGGHEEPQNRQNSILSKSGQQGYMEEFGRVQGHSERSIHAINSSNHPSGQSRPPKTSIFMNKALQARSSEIAQTSPSPVFLTPEANPSTHQRPQRPQFPAANPQYLIRTQPAQKGQFHPRGARFAVDPRSGDHMDLKRVHETYDSRIFIHKEPPLLYAQNLTFNSLLCNNPTKEGSALAKNYLYSPMESSQSPVQPRNWEAWSRNQNRQKRQKLAKRVRKGRKSQLLSNRSYGRRPRNILRASKTRKSDKMAQNGLIDSNLFSEAPFNAFNLSSLEERPLRYYSKEDEQLALRSLNKQPEGSDSGQKNFQPRRLLSANSPNRTTLDEIPEDKTAYFNDSSIQERLQLRQKIEKLKKFEKGQNAKNPVYVIQEHHHHHHPVILNSNSEGLNSMVVLSSLNSEKRLKTASPSKFSSKEKRERRAASGRRRGAGRSFGRKFRRKTVARRKTWDRASLEGKEGAQEALRVSLGPGSGRRVRKRRVGGGLYGPEIRKQLGGGKSGFYQF